MLLSGCSANISKMTSECGNNKKWHTRRSWLCHWCSSHLLMSSNMWSITRDLKQSGRQRQGRLRLKNEFLPLIRISKWLHLFTVSYGATAQLQHNVYKKRWVPNGNKRNLASRFRFADDANCGDFTLLFCIGRLRNVQSFKTHVLSYCSAN